jgi:hypothetical protein
MRQHPPPSSSPCAPVSPNNIRTIRPLFGWLLRPPIQQKPSKSEVWSLSLFLFFRHSICRPNRRVNAIPHAFHSHATPLQCPPHCRHYHLVGCYVYLSNGGHLRQVLHQSLNFSIGAILAGLRSESTPRVPSRSHLITSPRPPASANLRFVVVSIDKTAAT